MQVDRPSLECPARVAVSMLRAADASNNTDIVVLVPHSVRIRVPGATVRPVAVAAFKGHGSWENTFMKFRAVQLYEYDRVMFLDLDLLVLASPRYLFASAPATFTVAAPRAYWLGQPFLVSGGPMVFRPSLGLYDRFKTVLDGPRSSRQYPGEMDWFNEVFKDDAVALDGIETMLSGEFVPTDRVYAWWGKRMWVNASTTLRRATFLHFIATWKPWIHHPQPRTPELVSVYNRWAQIKQNVCATVEPTRSRPRGGGASALGGTRPGRTRAKARQDGRPRRGTKTREVYS